MIVTGLSGKVVVVTGGTSGIGRATALRFGEEGCRVAVWDRIAADEDLARQALIGSHPVPHGHATAFFSEAKRRGAADPGRPTCDDDHLAA